MSWAWNFQRCLLKTQPHTHTPPHTQKKNPENTTNDFKNVLFYVCLFFVCFVLFYLVVSCFRWATTRVRGANYQGRAFIRGGVCHLLILLYSQTYHKPCIAHVMSSSTFCIISTASHAKLLTFFLNK